MVKDLVMNVTIIISYIFIIGQLSQIVHLNGMDTEKGTERRNQVVAGVLFGILGMILMEFSIQVNERVIVDLRHIATVIAAVFFGVPGALLSSLIIGMSRILIFGGLNAVALSAAIGSFAIGAVCSLLLRLPLGKGLMSFVMNLSSIVIIYIDLYVNVVWLSDDSSSLFPIYSLHWSISLVGGAIAYYVTRYIITSNQAYQSLEQSNSRLHSLMNNLPSGTLVESPEREIELYNDKFRELYGLKEDDIGVGMSAREVETKNQLNYQTQGPTDRIESIVQDRKLIRQEELALSDGRTVERDYIPIFSSTNKFLGHMWNFRDITDRKQMENQLLESEQKYKSLFEHNQSATFILNPIGHFTALNHAAQTLTGYTLKELIQSAATPLIGKEVLKDTYDNFKRLLNGESLTFPSVLVKKSGEEVYVNVNAAPIIISGVITGVIGVAHDITEQKNAERQLKISEDRYRSLIQLSPEAIVVHSMSAIEFVNNQALKFTGASKKEDLIGRNVFDFLHEDDKEKASYFFSTSFMKKNPSTSFHELRFLRMDGKVIIGDVGAKIIDYNNERALLCMIHDVTEKKELEQELKKANQKLTKLAQLDGLTSIPNRRFFDYTLKQELARMKRNKTPLSLLLMDIDQFKVFNDTYGHLEGDRCLQEVAQAIHACLKRPGDFVARYGGEEFAVILPDTDHQGASLVGEDIRRGIERLAISHQNSTVNPYVTISVGITTIDPPSDISSSVLIQQADEALYASKERGRNCITGYDRVKK